jgi:hypothetical protein
MAIVCVGCGEAPEPVFVCCRCVCGSWHLQTAHTSDHYDLVVCGGVDNSPAHPALAHAAATMSSTPINMISKRVRGYKELPSSRGSMPRADVVENQLSSAIHSRLPTSNTIRARPKVLYSTVNENSSCPTAQVVGRNLLLLQQNRTEKSRRCGNGYILVWKPANKAFAGLCWCQIPMAGISWPQQWSDAARQPIAVT